MQVSIQVRMNAFHSVDGVVKDLSKLCEENGIGFVARVINNESFELILSNGAYGLMAGSEFVTRLQRFVELHVASKCLICKLILTF